MERSRVTFKFLSNSAVRRTPISNYVFLNRLDALGLELASATLKLLRYCYLAQRFSNKPPRYFLGYVNGNLLRSLESDFDRNSNLSGPDFSLALCNFVSRSSSGR